MHCSSLGDFSLVICVPWFIIEFASAELWFSTDAKFEDKVVLPASLSDGLNHTSFSISNFPVTLCYNGSLSEFTSHESGPIAGVDTNSKALVLSEADCSKLDFQLYRSLPNASDLFITERTGAGRNANVSAQLQLDAENDSFRISRVELSLNLIPDRLRTWLSTGQRIHVRFFPNSSIHETLHTPSPSIQATLESAATNARHVATVMFYVLLTCLLLFVLTSTLGLLGYVGQRIHRAHRMRRSSHRLKVATRKALKKLTLRTLLPTDKEVISGCDQCAICIELYRASDVVRILPCRHVYHKRCIDPWLLEQYSCPLCKLDILKSCGVPVDRLRVSDNSDSMRLSSEHSSSASSATDRFGHPASGGPVSWTRWGHRSIRMASYQMQSVHRCAHHCDHPHPRLCTAGCAHSIDDHRFGYSVSNAVFDSKQQEESLITDSARPSLFSPGRWTSLSHILWLCRFCFFIRKSEHHLPVCPDCCDSSCASSCSFARNYDISSDDRLCGRHASLLGVSLLPNILQLAQWRSYESHRKALEHHMTDVESCRRSSACMGFVPNRSTPKRQFPSRPTQCNLRLLCLQFAPCCKTRAPTRMQFGARPISSMPAEQNSCTSEAAAPLSDARSPGQHEAKVTVHWSKMDGCVLDVGGVGLQQTPDVTTDCRHTAPSFRSQASLSTQLEHCCKRLYISNERLPALSPVLTIHNTSPTSSTDGSSEPSLVVLHHVQHSPFGTGSHVTQRAKSQRSLATVSPTGKRQLGSHSFTARRTVSRFQSKRMRLKSHPYFIRGRTYISGCPSNRHKRKSNAPGTQSTAPMVSSKFEVIRGLMCFPHLSWSSRSKPPGTEPCPSISLTVDVDAPPSYQEATRDKHASVTDSVPSELLVSDSNKMGQLPRETAVPYSPLCPMCRSERAVKLLKPTSCSPARLCKPVCESSHDTRFLNAWTTGMENEKLLSYHPNRAARRFSSPTDSTPTPQSFDPQSHTPRSMHTGFFPSLQIDASAVDHMGQPQLCGIRVTVEPPEVQYHRGPSNSDSSAE
ncbi:unnamed protein product [Dicrocoelium dendriticum]|nr:unnamed protein product [Dicrocoelium dendriticum]